MPRATINKDDFLKILKDVEGNITAACLRSKLGRATYYNWRKADEDFQKRTDKIVEESTDRMNDFAEGKLFEHIKDGDRTSLIFYLKTRHPKYRLKQVLAFENKLQVERELTADEKELIKLALQYAKPDNNEPDRREDSNGQDGREQGVQDIPS